LQVYAQWYDPLHTYEAEQLAKGIPHIDADGPASIFVAVPRDNISMANLFFSEFFADTFIALAIW
jgi:hypothetical protein